ncbi:unnamed protein product [Rotaria sp. Silwood1]|nr:unnamed protein product [Rotaria sp. Silwood1]
MVLETEDLVIFKTLTLLKYSSFSGYKTLFFLNIGLHYGGVSLHFVDVNYKLRMFILACKLYDLPNQKAFNIREFVNKIVEDFGLIINEDIFIVSDNEPKMLSAFKEGVMRVGCSTYYINKVIQHAFELEESLCIDVQLLFSIVRDIISHIRQSHKQ